MRFAPPPPCVALGVPLAQQYSPAGMPQFSPPPLPGACNFPLPPPPPPSRVWRFPLPPPPLPPPLPPSGSGFPPPPLPNQPPPPPPQQPPPPSLPVPSQAVQRSRKKGKNATSDIWASAEEIQYEEGMGIAIEGGALTAEEEPSERGRRRRRKDDSGDQDKMDPCCPSADGYAGYRNRDQIEKSIAQKRRQRNEVHQQLPNPPLQVDRWYYIDNSSRTMQGPFDSVQMLGWKNMGL